MISSGETDVVILGSGMAGLAAALAADELGLRAIVLEKSGTLGGGTVHSYGLRCLHHTISRTWPQRQPQGSWTAG